MIVLAVVGCNRVLGYDDDYSSNRDGFGGTGWDAANGGTGAGTSGGTAGAAADAGMGLDSGTDGFAGTDAMGGSGGDADTAGDGGAAGNAGAAGAGAEPTCPDAGAPTMVEVPGGYCIDSTEVSRIQYADWLATDPSFADQPTFCSWNDDYDPNCAWPPGDDPDLPVVCVDWCDAHAYCKGVGKRLCGKIGGGANPYADYADTTKSEWFAACSRGGSKTYTWGNAYNAEACNGGELSTDHVPVAVGSLSTCQSYAGVYDLSGNVWEWVDSCDASVGEPTYVVHAVGASIAGRMSSDATMTTTTREKK